MDWPTRSPDVNPIESGTLALDMLGGETHARGKKDKKWSRRTKLRGVLQASCCLKRSDCCLPPTPVYFLEDSRRFYELLSPVLLLLSLTVLQLRMPGHRKRRQFKQTDAFTRGMVIGLKRADHSISTRTISRRLVANGLHSCRPLRRLPLTPPNRRQRLEWCRARSTWMTEWHRVVFSDESRFCLSSDSRRVRVWRQLGERSNPAAIVERPTVRQRGIMVWGAIAYDSRSPLLRIQGTMTAQRYVDDVLRPVTLPYLQGVPNALYQQNNARPHTARISQQVLQDVQMLPWPPYSPDLSPIEHVWDIIGRRLHAFAQPRSEDELWQMFNVVAQANGWNVRDKASFLAAVLRGSAVEVLQMIPEQFRLEFNALIDALESRYGEEHYQQLHVVKFKNRLQEKKESLQDLAHVIRSLARLAFPTCPFEIQDFMAQHQFIDAIGDPETQKFARLSSATTLQETLVQDMKYEAAQQATIESYRVARQVKWDDPKKGRCWICRAHDHMSPTCFRKVKQRSDTGCWKCEKDGHIRKTCLDNSKDKPERKRGRCWNSGAHDHISTTCPRREMHSSPTGGHFGIRKTLSKVRERFCGPGSRTDVEKWCRNCTRCSVRKGPTTRSKGKVKIYNYQWEGPYKIIKCLNDVIFRIQKTPTSRPKVEHYNRLALFRGTVPEQWTVRDDQS
ncbi:hypothetical protein LAZ67_21001699 [Cordylochernes scorpioides]|uniref:CCHC-type domain-containing protein n=1 Tax=Cordylochernes scorpioides TaxID=51811 RepID=A0ABY6LPV2_9ARAC|nr:hypothetical protein LAZ67_21001699 [Cordylochernes scorpioides]